MRNEIITGDCFEELDRLDEDSVHAVVTDPPYGLAFMGRSWDDFEPKEYQAWCEKWATECLRVLKPGGHLLAFSGNRTHHRLMSGIEDAGFEIRDTITWHYGSGFPKALDVSKAIDKQAEQWDGFKSALKPATEFVCVARSPLAEDTIAENVVAHGTGALNIDACRIGNDINEVTTTTRTSERNQNAYGKAEKSDIRSASPKGRYPSNVVFDAQQADVLDSKNEETNGGDVGGEWKGSHSMYDGMSGGASSYEDSGGPSRYFYTSKASRSERTLDGKIDNAHPTVKPIDLMEWLVSLATAEEQIVLDPFAGSGTTCKAAKNKTRQFIGIEQQAKWADVARVRSGLPPDDHSHIRSDDEQHGLEQYQ